jgi:hypothetical protein
MNALLIALLALSPAQPNQPTTGDAPNRPADAAVIAGDYRSCGINSLYVVCKMRSIPVRFEQLRELVGPSDSDMTHSFADLVRAAEQLGLPAVPMNVPFDQLDTLPMPLLVQIRSPHHPELPPHFLVVTKIEGGQVWLLDAPYPLATIGNVSFARAYSGNVLVFPVSSDQLAGATAPGRWSVWAKFVLPPLALVAVVLLLAVPRRFAVVLARARLRRAIAGFAVVGLTAAVALFGALYWNRQPTPPQLVFEREDFSLGELKIGTTHVEIPIRNDSDSPLHITGVRSSCTCAVVNAPSDLPPGGRGVIDVELAVARGGKTATVLVESNDPRGAQAVTLDWRGTAGMEILSPNAFNLSAPLTAGALTKTIEVTYPGGDDSVPPVLERWESDSPLLHVSAGSVNPNAERVTINGKVVQVLGRFPITCTVAPPQHPGLFIATGTLHLRQGEETLARTVVFSIDFTQTGAVEQASLLFSGLRRSSLVGQERTISIAPKDAKESFTLAQNVPDWLAVSLTRDGSARYQLHVRVAAQPPARICSHVIEIQGASPAPPIRIPVRILTSSD